MRLKREKLNANRKLELPGKRKQKRKHKVATNTNKMDKSVLDQIQPWSEPVHT